ncbi:MAG TPA: TonB-dependent receptor [Bacteroidales bacterium]|nr:TonB-dependent receptor [Bacteroidales bacterium]HPS61716.1 TonB-dependent receptor [Bacteroidales bacterium]
MRTRYILLAFLFILTLRGTGQPKAQPVSGDTTIRNLNEVVISALRVNTPLNQIPASISVVSGSNLNALTKTIAADDALRLVPGVRIDNGTGGSRVHVYIRGQGVLTESGFRGIGVTIDGISLNTPGGYAPDLYDVDWETVKNVEVVKGLAASLYGASATGGMINIITQDGGKNPLNSSLYTTAGSNGFWKVLGQVDGTRDNVNYRVSYSHVQSHGYRIHQAYMGDNLSEKITWTPSARVKVTQLLNYTSYFNQNSEGINLGRYDTVGHTAANTDAIRYNEFHKTQRLTGGAIVKYTVAKNQDLTLKGYIRMNHYQETSNNGDDRRPSVSNGLSAQYNLGFGKENLFNHLSLGVDYQSMNMKDMRDSVPDGDHINSNRVDEYWSEEIFDLKYKVKNQVARQHGVGIFLIDKLDIAKRLYATLNLRYDYVYNKLDNYKRPADTLAPIKSGSRTFQKPTFRIGLAYDLAKAANLYASYGTGYLIPTGDELYNNPVTWEGFNSQIKPTTSQGGEIGVRGEIGKLLYYDVTAFDILSKDEFYRYSIPERGPNTAFFGNVGSSTRWGVETYVSLTPFDFLKLNVAYTYSHFQYTSNDSANGHKGHWIPQSPEHQLTTELEGSFLKHFTATANIQYSSKWYIQVDDSIYNYFTENGVKRSSCGRTGYFVVNAGLKYAWKLGTLKGELGFFCKNLLDEQYFGFTEPNNGSDYNSFQAAPGREFFVSLRLRL